MVDGDIATLCLLLWLDTIVEPVHQMVGDLGKPVPNVLIEGDSREFFLLLVFWYVV